MSRLNAKVRCNYYPLPLSEAERIRNLLQFPVEPFSALDPCVGDGAAFAAITRDSSARRYGIELDAYRAEQAGPSLPRLFRETVWKPIAPSSRSRSAFAIPRTTGRSQVTLGNDLRRCS